MQLAFSTTKQRSASLGPGPQPAKSRALHAVRMLTRTRTARHRARNAQPACRQGNGVPTLPRPAEVRQSACHSSYTECACLVISVSRLTHAGPNRETTKYLSLVIRVQFCDRQSSLNKVNCARSLSRKIWPIWNFAVAPLDSAMYPEGIAREEPGCSASNMTRFGGGNAVCASMPIAY